MYYGGLFPGPCVLVGLRYSINFSYVIMETMVWEMFAFAAVCMRDFVVLEEQLFSISLRGLFFFSYFVSL